MKWLAEKRARTAYDLKQAEGVLSEIAKRVANQRLDLIALDRALTIYDPTIDPQKIEPVNGWQGTYGRRGTLRETAIKVLQQHAPNWVNTSNLELFVTTELGLSFETPSLRLRWYRNTLTPTLRKLVAEQLVERQHDPLKATSELGGWRWRQEKALTLAGLRGALPSDSRS